MNKFIHIGRLVADPELKKTPDGRNVVTFRCAVHRPFTKDKTDFFSYEAWGKLAERIVRNFRKGYPIAMSGHEKVERWQDSEGAHREKHVHVIEELDFCGMSLKKDEQTDTDESSVSQAYTPIGEGYEDLSSEELPF